MSKVATMPDDAAWDALTQPWLTVVMYGIEMAFILTSVARVVRRELGCNCCLFF